MPGQAVLPEEKGEAGVLPSRGSDAKPQAYAEFVSFWFLGLSVATVETAWLWRPAVSFVPLPTSPPSGWRWSREKRALKSCLHLSPSPQPRYGSLTRKVLDTWLFGLLSMKMSGSLRGRAWPGGCASTSKVIIAVILP